LFSIRLIRFIVRELNEPSILFNPRNYAILLRHRSISERWRFCLMPPVEASNNVGNQNKNARFIRYAQ
ncbi:hypothetical protein, partial [uncultured Muribaculum sp.]|uniref:hypothetical protein n=1 Tax=uncultured Muribaculum sp. TaxID=1918613 RepID=UPI003220208A